MKKRRDGLKTFSVLLPREDVERFEKWLEEQHLTKAKWLKQKIDEVLGK